MKRLTKKEVEKLAISILWAEEVGMIFGENAAKQTMIEMLEYKNIEEELGIDLITLHRALSNGCFVKFGKESIWFQPKEYISIRYGELCLHFDYNLPKCCAFKDYGITWALTKEELE